MHKIAVEGVNANKVLHVVCILTTVATLVGCASDPATSRGGLSTSGEMSTIHDTRLLAGNCLYGWPEPEAAFLAGLAAAVLPSLIDKGVATLASTIKEAGEEATYQVAVERPLQLAKGKEGIPQCLQLVRGHFFTDKLAVALPEKAWLPAGTSYPTTEELWEVLSSLGLTLAGEPELFVEIPVFQARDGSALAASVRQVTYNKHLGSRRFRSSNEAHGLAVNIAFMTPDQTDIAEVPVASLDLGKLQPGHTIVYRTPHELRHEPSSGPTSGAAPGVPPTTVTGGTPPTPAAGPLAPGTGLGPVAPPGPGAGGPQAAEDTTITVLPVVSTSKMLPLTSRWIPMALSENAKPVTVWVQAVDRQDSNRVLTFIGETLEASKEQVAQVIKTELVPGERERIRIEEATANRANVQAYFTAYSTAETALAEYRTAAFNANGQPIVSLAAVTAALKARAAQEDANTAALIAGRNPPYGSKLAVPNDHRPGT